MKIVLTLTNDGPPHSMLEALHLLAGAEIVGPDKMRFEFEIAPAARDELIERIEAALELRDAWVDALLKVTDEQPVRLRGGETPMERMLKESPAERAVKDRR
jgi:hypothetical protein